MTYLKFTPYIYLIAGLYFIYHGFTEYQAGTAPWLSFGIAALAIFMFFFRLRFARKFEERRRNQDKP
jgi:hypothetical protein